MLDSDVVYDVAQNTAQPAPVGQLWNQLVFIGDPGTGLVISINAVFYLADKCRVNQVPCISDIGSNKDTALEPVQPALTSSQTDTEYKQRH